MRNPIYSVTLLGIVSASVAGAFTIWSKNSDNKKLRSMPEKSMQHLQVWMCSDLARTHEFPTLNSIAKKVEM